MSDVFDDLAKAFKAGHDAGRSEAADEIERLREALRGIACSCDADCERSPLGLSPATMNCGRYRARAALGEKE